MILIIFLENSWKIYKRKEWLKLAQDEHRVCIRLTEDEFVRLENLQSETGKSKSELLKEVLYQERKVMDAQFADSIWKIGCWIDSKDYDKIKKEVMLWRKQQVTF